MHRFSLSRSRGVLRIDSLLLVLFALSAGTGLLSPLERAFMVVMAEAPPASNYVVVIALLGRCCRWALGSCASDPPRCGPCSIPFSCCWQVSS